MPRPVLTKTYEKPPTRCPEPYPDEKGLQVNACQNYKCDNFGVPADPAYKPHGAAALGHPDPYRLYMTSQSKVYMKCNTCERGFQVRSNQAIHEEMSRHMKHLLKPALSCPDPECVNHLVSVDAGTEHYYTHTRFKTRGGCQRYQCRTCKKTFSRKKTPTFGQRKVHKNVAVFRAFLSGATMRKVARTTMKMAPTTLYGKLDFFYRQCVAFAASRERRFLDDRPILVDDPGNPGKKVDAMRRLYVSVDQMSISLNWPTKWDQRVTKLMAIGSMEEGRKYLYSLQLNYDTDVDWSDVRDYNDSNNQDVKKLAFRRYARFITPEEHEVLAVRNMYMRKFRERTEKRIMNRKLHNKPTVDLESAFKYVQTKHRPDPESPDDEYGTETKIPDGGMLVFGGYFAFGHFHMLRQLFHKAGKIRFSFEQEGAFVGAALSAFADRIREKRCDLFYVMFEKFLGDGKKKEAYDRGMRFIRRAAKVAKVSQAEVRLILLKRAIRKAKPRGKYDDLFIVHPFPPIGTPYKQVSYITDRGAFSPDGVTDEDHLARLYDKTCMHNLDTFILQIRSAIKLFHDPTLTGHAGPEEGKYCVYHPYRPDLVPKWLEIYRTYHNYCLVSDIDKKTPAMRMGLAKRPILEEEILRFRPG